MDQVVGEKLKDGEGDDHNVENHNDHYKTTECKYLTASELFNLRRNFCKNKGKDEEVEIYKGHKLYVPASTAEEQEILSGIFSNFRMTLNLQRGAKIRDCMKAEWNEELNVAVVSQLKGKITQHMGRNLKGKTALSPEEALFLLEKNCIEILRNNMPMSIEEGYAVMLKGKFALEKYQVYSHLSQQGFIVVSHQPRISSAVKKLNERKRAAISNATGGPEAKRTSFCGILNQEMTADTNTIEKDSSINTISSTLSNDCDVLSSDSLNKSDSVINDILIINKDLIPGDSSHLEEPKESDNDQDKAPSPDSTNRIDLSNLSEKELLEKAKISTDSKDTNNENSKSDTLVCLDKISDANLTDKSISSDNETSVTDAQECLDKNKQLSVDDVVSPDKSCETNINTAVISPNKDEMELSDTDNISTTLVKDKESLIIKDSEKSDTGVTNNNRITENMVESVSDSNDIIVEDDQKSEDNDVIVESSSSDYNNEYTDESIPAVCDESTVEESLDVLSCSSDYEYDEITSQSNGDHLKEADDEILLVEVKKKESTPLAVIDLLSDNEEETEQSNDDKIYDEDDDDDDIQIVKVCTGVKNYPKPGSRNSVLVKKECKTEIKSNTEIKTPFHRQLKFPQMYKKDVLCIQRPPVNYLPFSVRPSKEAYVINIKKPAEAPQGRVWNSWKDLQNYQRDQRLSRQANNDRPFNSLRDFRFHSDSQPFRGNAFIRQDNSFNMQENPFHRQDNSFNRQENPFNRQENPFNRQENMTDFDNNRNTQNFVVDQNRNFNSPLPSMTPQTLRPTLLPSSDVFNLQDVRPPFMNMHNPTSVFSELQRTMYSMAQNMLSSMIGQHMNPMSPSLLSSPAYNVTSMLPHSGYDNYSSGSPMLSQNTGINSPFRPDIHQPEFQSRPTFSEERFPNMVDRGTMFEMNGRQNSFNHRNNERKGPLFPCHYRQIRKKRSWNDVQSAVSRQEEKKSDSGSDIEEIPINWNQFLNSNNIQPTIKPGSRLPVVEVLPKLKNTQMAGFLDLKKNVDKCLPESPSLEISFDVYLPGFKYKKTAPEIPKRRIVVSRSDEPIVYSELVVLQRKFSDGAVLQVAVVDHGDISFYCYNSSCIPDIIPYQK